MGLVQQIGDSSRGMYEFDIIFQTVLYNTTKWNNKKNTISMIYLNDIFCSYFEIEILKYVFMIPLPMDIA